jgi:hypothetical protein
MPQHVGVYRVDRFVRWLSEAGAEVVLVRAGRRDGATKTSWGVEIEILDPLGRSWDAEPDMFAEVRKSALRWGLDSVVNWFFNPDPAVLWARRAARHPLVLENAKGAGLVLASSPPESVHVAAALLATRLKVDLVVDMRDGWLDEPLKAYLGKISLLRWWEGKLERRILRQARQIFVTSDVWKEMLSGRLPFTETKTAVLTNCYPNWSSAEASIPRVPSPPKKCTLLHAGSFTKSKFNNRPVLLLERLWEGLPVDGENFQVVLQGQMSVDDLADIESWREKFTTKGVEIIIRPPVSRDQLPTQLQAAGGLLMLSATRASILAKIYEYLPSRRPILAITFRGSSVWRLATEVPQLFIADIEDLGHSRDAISCFLDACITDQFDSDVPDRFSEEQNRRIFLEHIGSRIEDLIWIGSKSSLGNSGGD